MSYLVFARKWRPQDFNEIVGQEHITTTLKNAIRLNRISQAYLFTGPRGVGKTSTARILAKMLNCKNGPTPSPCNKCATCLEITNSNSLDVMEIDGASNRRIDDIRNLRENVKFSPVNGKFKIYIIDEVHQVTDEAFNALLKTLEEPPPHVKFIFATTQPHKIPATILSRCQRFDFRRIQAAEIVEKLKEIAKAEKIDAQDSVFFEIARASDGSMRDAESILDQLNSFCEKKIEISDVAKVLGIIEEGLLLEIAELISKKDITALLKRIDDLTNSGKDLFQFLARFIEHIRNLSVIKVNKNLRTTLALSDSLADELTTQSEKFSLEDLIYFFYLLSSTYESARKTGLIRFTLEFALIKMVRRSGIMPIDELLKRVNKLEAGGCGAPAGCEAKPVDPPAAEDLPRPSQSSDDITAVWPDLLKRLSRKKASLASFLTEGEPAGIDENGIIKVDFPKMHKFHKEILEEPESKKIIEEIAKAILGISVKIEFHLVDKLARKNNFKLVDEADEKKEEDPLLKDALDVFNGSIVKNNKFNSNG